MGGSMNNNETDPGVLNETADELMTDGLLLSVMPELSEKQIEQLISYYDILIETNRVMNLTRITSPREAAEKHFADSMIGAALIPENARVVDVGTGAGFPGIPLKIIRPDIRLVMIDSLGKRVKFLEEACSRIGIETRAVHARAEDAARDDGLRAGFDTALSRAVAPMDLLIELTVPFLKVGGSSLMYKGAGVSEELALCGAATRELCCELRVHEYDVPWGARTIAEAVKTAKTPSRYPRKAGIPQKKPLR